jgi:hypothetical protein
VIAAITLIVASAAIPCINLSITYSFGNFGDESQTALSRENFPRPTNKNFAVKANELRELVRYFV